MELIIFTYLSTSIFNFKYLQKIIIGHLIKIILIIKIKNTFWKMNKKKILCSERKKLYGFDKKKKKFFGGEWMVRVEPTTAWMKAIA